MSDRTLSLSGGPAAYTVTLDGRDLSRGLRSVSIEVRPGHRPTVTAELNIHAIEVTTLGVQEPDFVLSMPDEAREALIALGWTPPAGT